MTSEVLTDRGALLVPELPRAATRTWERRYVKAAIAVDVLGAAIAGAVAFWYSTSQLQGPSMAYFAESLILPVLWTAAIATAGGYERRFLGNGPEEYRRVALGAFGLMALVGFASWATQAEIARGHVIVALPTAIALTWIGRYSLRKWVHHQRRRGEFLHRTLIAGPAHGVRELADRLKSSYHGYRVLGACVPRGSAADDPGAVPILGSLDDIADAVNRVQADTVAVVPSADVSGDTLRRLSWELEPTGATLLVAPALIDVAGPRMVVRPVEGLPLLHVEHPRFTGLRRIIKGIYDPVFAGLLLVFLSPLLLVIAAAIKADSPGPVLFRQTRIGKMGKPFTIYKFRTMVRDAEQRRVEVSHLNDSEGPLFKALHDPRVTRVGAFLRRTSLDELPQLYNVIINEMSLVGPRPHLPEEVALFEEEMSRRLFVKPGITGLWQTSGRSDLSWEESIRLDLRYVENWTFTWDLYIIWKTLSAIRRGSGAY